MGAPDVGDPLDVPPVTWLGRVGGAEAVADCGRRRSGVPDHVGSPARPLVRRGGRARHSLAIAAGPAAIGGSPGRRRRRGVDPSRPTSRVRTSRQLAEDLQRSRSARARWRPAGPIEACGAHQVAQPSTPIVAVHVVSRPLRGARASGTCAARASYPIVDAPERAHLEPRCTTSRAGRRRPKRLADVSPGARALGQRGELLLDLLQRRVRLRGAVGVDQRRDGLVAVVGRSTIVGGLGVLLDVDDLVS